jgi:trans-aconitate methyltransferase
LRDAIDMLAESGVEALGPTIWADLGCGDGTFTRADMLTPGSLVHAIDLDGSALQRIPSAHKGVRISTHCADFMKQPWPFSGLDGILMANSLHYVENQAGVHSRLRISHETTATLPSRRIRRERGQPLGPVSHQPD